jgi:hypothetical protein
MRAIFTELEFENNDIKESDYNLIIEETEKKHIENDKKVFQLTELKAESSEEDEPVSNVENERSKQNYARKLKELRKSNYISFETNVKSN